MYIRVAVKGIGEINGFQMQFCTRYHEFNFHCFFLLKLSEISLDAGTHEGFSKLNAKPVPLVSALIFLFVVFKSFEPFIDHLWEDYFPAREQRFVHLFY